MFSDGLSFLFPKANQATWLEKVALPQADAKADLQKISQTTPLTDKQLAMVPIAFYATRGDLVQLKPALAQGLASGLTVNELREIFAHQYAYAGFPRALNGLLTYRICSKNVPNKAYKTHRAMHRSTPPIPIITPSAPTR